MKALVTGATGFVGSALIRHLISANYEVRALTRHKSNKFLLEGLNVEVYEGDIIYPDSVDKAVKGCQVVFNLASIYTFYPFWDKEAKPLYKANVFGTVNMLEAALKHKVERFIHTSTIATISKRLDGKPSNEETGFDFKGAIHYARSKYLAEQEVLNYCKKGLPAIILNPAIIIGEMDYKPTPSGEAIVKFLNRKYPVYFDSVWSVADVDDVARAHISAIKHGKIGERYILCNKEHHILKEIFDMLEDISGIKAPRIKIPYFLLFAFVYVEEWLSYTFLHKKPLLPTEGVRFCKMSIIYDNSKAVKELNYNPTPIRETLKKAVLWYRLNSYIDPPGFFRIKSHGSKIIEFLMKKIGMDRFTDKLNLGTVIFFLIVKSLQLLEKAGLKPSEDGWRKVTRCYLRTEHSKFALAVFRLDFYSDLTTPHNKTFASSKEHIIERVAQFLRKYPAIHWQLKWYTFSAEREKKEYIDIVYAKFNNTGALEEIDPYLDRKQRNVTDEMPIELKNSLILEIIKVYNKTRNLKDKKRPRILKKILRGKILSYSEPERSMAGYFIERVLSAIFIHFEIISDINKRFHTPTFIKFKHPGFGFLNILCRFTDNFNEADLWFQFSHIPDDGTPMQEILNNLKREWDICGKLEFPVSGYKKRNTRELCSTDNHKTGVYHIDDFVDFRPLLKQRRELNKKYTDKISGTITFVALFIWKLSHYPAFEDIKFAIAVDLKATSHRERTLGFVFIRPSIYFDGGRGDEEFIKFQRDFNRELHATWKRNSESYNLLERYALTSPIMYSATIKLMHKPLSEFVGTVGITIIKEADLFISPSSDVHTHGFIAISNFFISGEDGSEVCNVSIKGPKDKIENYLKTIKEVAASRE